jgi:hypothetical protein
MRLFIAVLTEKVALLTVLMRLGIDGWLLLICQPLVTNQENQVTVDM